MSTLVLSDEQFRLLSTAGFSLPITDSRGRIVAMASPPPFTQEEIDEFSRLAASDEPRRSSAEVFARLKELAEAHGETNE